MSSAESTTNQILQVRLQARDLLGQALEMENSVLQAEVQRLQEHLAAAPRSYGLSEPPQTQAALPNRTSLVERNRQVRPLTERLDWADTRSQPRNIVSRRREVANRTARTRPSTVVINPVGFHSRFLPLGDHFQEGGTGSPLFSQPQDWPDAISKNPSLRPCGVRYWGTQPVNLNDLHVYLHIGKIIYGGNRPPNRIDPRDPQRPWKTIEKAFYRATVILILQPETFTEICEQLTLDQRTQHPQPVPFLAPVENANQLPLEDVAEHLIRSGSGETWIRRDNVIGYAQSYLRDWARHRSEIRTNSDLGRLFVGLYPSGVDQQNDRGFVEDAAIEMLEGTAEVPMDEEEDEIPPLEPRTPSTPEDERVRLD